jgi:hypothetical protein
MATIDVKDAAGVTVAIEKPLTPGRAAAASSRPVALSTEDLAALGATNETAPASDTATSGINGRQQRIAQNITTMSAKLPAALGQTTMAASMSVAIASNQSAVPISDNSGTITVDAPVATPVFVRLSDGSAAVTPLVGAQLPSSLGIKTAANSLSVTLASDGTLPLPSGASTAANQSTLNTAIGSSSSAVVANGASGDIAGYLRTIKDAATDTTTASPVTVRTPCDVIAITPVLDTSIYASGNVLFDSTAISGAVRASDERAVLMSISVIDKDDQKPAMRLVFLKANVSLGTANAAPSISDANAANYLGHVDIAAADYCDLGGVSVACAKAINLLLESASGTTTVYMAAYLTAGTPTHTASGLVFNIGVIHS